MKIVHLNTNSDSGGAAIAAKRHCQAMIAAGIDAKMVAYRGFSDNNGAGRRDPAYELSGSSRHP